MSLSDDQALLVRACIPVLREHGETVTTLFYTTMLRDHPELNNIFNATNQANGRQARALTSAILAFAENMSDTSEVMSQLERTAHKHVSLGVRPEQYEIVGFYLIQAFSQVLGPAVWTAEIDAAWKQAYGILTQMLTGREAELYRDFEADHWAGFRPFRIDRKVAETDDIFSFYLVPTDNRPLPSFRPGQYVSLRLKVESTGHFQIRQYSLSDAPRPDYYRITVKRDDGLRVGKGAEALSLNPGIISNLLVGETKPGDTVELSHPAGDFHLEPDASATHPLVLISAGVGATPLLSILNSALDARDARPLSWLHGSARDGPFEKHVRHAAGARDDFATRFFRSKGSSSAGGEEASRLDLARVDPAALHLGYGAAEYYICGPTSFMDDMAAWLVASGVDKKRVRYEWFTTGDVEMSKFVGVKA